MSRELEATIRCPACSVDKFDVYRVPTGREGVFTHVTEPADIGMERMKHCECGAVLERK